MFEVFEDWTRIEELGSVRDVAVGTVVKAEDSEDNGPVVAGRALDAITGRVWLVVVAAVAWY